MQFINLDAGTIEFGLRTFDAYRRSMLCGSQNAIAHEVALERPSGPRTLPGIIAGCIDHGLDREDEIVSVAARASKCRKRTVSSLLHALSGNDPVIHLWARSDGRYTNRNNLARPEEWTIPVVVAA